MSPPPYRTHPHPPLYDSYTWLQSKHSHDDIRRSDDLNNDKPYINPNQDKERIEAPAATSSSTAAAATTTTTISSTSTPPRFPSTLHSTRHTKKSSHHKHSLPHRRVFRSFPRLPHAFTQPSTYRYFPYIPISITVRQTVERNSIDENEKTVEEDTLGGDRNGMM
jgi:hypothetical protein